jgi:hypothetical protein
MRREQLKRKSPITVLPIGPPIRCASFACRRFATPFNVTGVLQADRRWPQMPANSRRVDHCRGMRADIPNRTDVKRVGIEDLA